MTSSSSDHYTTLGIRPDAPEVVIKAAYKALAQQHHPDRGGNHAAMQQINEAYEVLSDRVRRATYDESLNPKEQKPEPDDPDSDADWMVSVISSITIPITIMFYAYMKGFVDANTAIISATIGVAVALIGWYIHSNVK